MPLHGPRQTDCSFTWRIWAPRCKQVQLVLFRDGRTQIVDMSRLWDGWFAASHPHCEEHLRYGFRLNGERVRPDPASRWQPEGVHYPSGLYFPEKFDWTDIGWRGIRRADLVFYELHVGTFTTAGTFDGVISRLPHLLELGINAVVLMPVAQFPGTRDWGYNGVHPFAVQNSYGGPAGLQRLVDACHRLGLAIFLDVVYNHLGPEGNFLSEFGPYEHPTPWGVALNFDDQKCAPVRHFVLENVHYWLHDFHIDGLRLDTAHSIVDRSESHILEELKQIASDVGIAQSRITHIVAEWDMNEVTFGEPRDHHGGELTAQWSDDFHHSVHSLLTHKCVGCYSEFGDPDQLVKVLNDNLVHGNSDRPQDDRDRATTRTFPGSLFVASIQNHDHVGDRAKGDRFGTLLMPEQQRLAAGVLILSPFLPLLFMGEEYGERSPFPYFCSFNEKSMVDVVRRRHRCEFADFDWPEARPDPLSPVTFHSARLHWQWDVGSWQGGLRQWYRILLRARRGLRPLGDSIHRVALWHDRKAVNGGSVVEDIESDKRNAATACSLDQRQGILELIRGSDDSRIVVYFNFSNNIQTLSGTLVERIDLTEWRPILSSEWPGFGGRHADVTCPRRKGDSWHLLPFEVLVLSSTCNEELWRLDSPCPSVGD